MLAGCGCWSIYEYAIWLHLSINITKIIIVFHENNVLPCKVLYISCLIAVFKTRYMCILVSPIFMGTNVYCKGIGCFVVIF